MTESASTPRPATTDRVHVAVLLDRSGSMHPIAADTVGGFNTFLAEQRAQHGDCVVTLVQFDGPEPQRVVADAVPVREMVDLTLDDYQPRGATPLLDALGMLITRLDRRVAADPDEAQLVAVITDGHENASTDHTTEQVARLVKDRTAAGWAFVFLGADLADFDHAADMGVARGMTARWDHTGEGIRRGLASMSLASSRYRAASRTEREHLRSHLIEDPADTAHPGDVDPTDR